MREEQNIPENNSGLRFRSFRKGRSRQRETDGKCALWASYRNLEKQTGPYSMNFGMGNTTIHQSIRQPKARLGEGKTLTGG